MKKLLLFLVFFTANANQRIEWDRHYQLYRKIYNDKVIIAGYTYKHAYGAATVGTMLAALHTQRRLFIAASCLLALFAWYYTQIDFEEYAKDQQQNLNLNSIVNRGIGTISVSLQL